MRDLKNKLTSSKNTKNIQTRKGKSFGYQVLGFGAGGSKTVISLEYLVIAGGGSGGDNSSPGRGNGGGGAGGYRTASSFELFLGDVYTATVGAGGGRFASGNNSVLATITSTGGGIGRRTGEPPAPNPKT